MTDRTVTTAGLNDLLQAAALGQVTVDPASRTLGSSHRLTLSTAANLTGVLARLGGKEQARALGQNTLDRARRTLGPDHVITFVSAANLAFVLAQTRR